MSRDDEVLVKKEYPDVNEGAAETMHLDDQDDAEEIDFEDDGHNCSICLQELVDRTVIPTCSHEFCFECLLIWTEQSRKCPLCNQSVGDHLIHNIRSNYDYQRHYLNPLRTSPKPLRAAQSTAAAPIRRRRAEREWGRRAARQEELDRLDESIRKRRWVYQHGLYAKHVASNSFTRYRPYPTPAQFAASHDMVARTTAFLRRELQVWVNLDVEFLTTFIISIMKSIDIRAESAIKLLAEFLDMDSPYVEGNRHPNAEHFAHEVYSFVRSPYKDLFVYDRVVQVGKYLYSELLGTAQRRGDHRDHALPRHAPRSGPGHDPGPGADRPRVNEDVRPKGDTPPPRFPVDAGRRSRGGPSPMRGLSPCADIGAAPGGESATRRRAREGGDTHARGRGARLSEKARGKLPVRGERHHHTRGHDAGRSPGPGSACAQPAAAGRHLVGDVGEGDRTEDKVLVPLSTPEGAEGASKGEGDDADAPVQQGGRPKKPPRPFSLRDSVHAHILGNAVSRAPRAELQRTHPPSGSSKQDLTQGGAAPPEQPPALLARLSDPSPTNLGPETQVARSHRRALLERLSDRLTEGLTPSNGPPGGAQSHTPAGEHRAPPPRPSEQLRAREAPGGSRKAPGHAARAAPLVSPGPRDGGREGDRVATDSEAEPASDEGRARLLRRLMKERGAVRRVEGQEREVVGGGADALAMEAELRSRAKVRMRLAALKGDVA
ncbi:hypothetical protein HDZ31DRAFT_42606 [Schizophyllum fasciatum]